jgi:hypothetical protein
VAVRGAEAEEDGYGHCGAGDELAVLRVLFGLGCSRRECDLVVQKMDQMGMQ